MVACTHINGRMHTYQGQGTWKRLGRRKKKDVSQKTKTKFALMIGLEMLKKKEENVHWSITLKKKKNP